MKNGIGYNDNAREYIKRNLNASRYLRRQQETAPKVSWMSKVKGLLTFQNVLLVLLISLVVYMVINAPAAMDAMWEQQYKYEE